MYVFTEENVKPDRAICLAWIFLFVFRYWVSCHRFLLSCTFRWIFLANKARQPATWLQTLRVWNYYYLLLNLRIGSLLIQVCIAFAWAEIRDEIQYFIVPILISHTSHEFLYLQYAQPHLWFVWIGWQICLWKTKEIHVVTAIVWLFQWLQLYDSNF